ncbi:MAG: aminotransferase class V-fold PLP-dependent enzyme [Armatimonadetes bacterium]|nr:MAG: aminotransferase class V-fold PLP-dependent enzyme [Armatimonadota bacterium]
MLPDQSLLFDVPHDVTYLNSAYFGPRLHSVAKAGEESVALTGRPWEVAADAFFEPVEQLRGLVAKAMNGDADGVALIPGISYGAGTAAKNLAIGPGRTVVMLDAQFPSNVYPWRTKVAAEGGEIVTVPRTPDGWTTAILNAIDDRTAVVTVPNCHWTDGSIVDLVAVGNAARDVGAALCVDASQSFCAMPLDVADVQPDFVYSVGYKWQLGFYGLAYLWVAPQHRAGGPLEEGWATREGAEDFAGLVDYTDAYHDGARRFDVGERSNFIGVAMANAAMTQIDEWGVANIAETLRSRTDTIAAGATEAGWLTAPSDQRSPHLIGIRHPDGLPADIADVFRSNRISVSVRGDSIRISPHLHTTDRDVERLFAALRAAS